MFLLIQLLNAMTPTEQELFGKLFSDLDYELDEMGWRGNETDLVNDMLFNHFGFSIDDEAQLQKITETILNKEKLRLTLSAAKTLQ